MNILITGGAGYLGGAVTDELLKTEHNITVYDSLVYEESYRKNVKFVYGDILDHEKLKYQLNQNDVCIWLAALVGDGACALNPEKSIIINQESIKWLSLNYSGRIIFPSTCSVYGAQENSELLTEDSETNPLSIYAQTKLGAEQYLKNENALVFRLGTLFGVSDQFARIRADLVVNTMTILAYTTNKIQVFGGSQFRPVIHVRDVARTIVEQIETMNTGIFNLHKQNIKIVDLAHQIRNHFEDLEIETTEMTFQDARNYKVSSDKAKEKLGFNPIFPVDIGIEEIKTLLTEKRLVDIKNPRYTNQKFLELIQKEALGIK